MTTRKTGVEFGELRETSSERIICGAINIVL
jgi:hypothetical protein